MNDTVYQTARWLSRLFRYHIIGAENIVPDRPKIFISNHAGSLGPLSILITLPVKLHPWVIAEMVDIPRTAEYLYKDFVKPAWHLNGHVGKRLSHLLAPIAVGVIKSVAPIPVDRNRGWCREAFHDSLDLLLAGENLLIFPEIPERPANSDLVIRPFLGGFCWLSHMYQSATGQPLAIQPMAVYPPRRRIILGLPVFLNLSGDPRKAIHRSIGKLESIVGLLYERISSPR
jgi:1-acyl-sn-glycerol-3-phosphate acyltransferase